MIRYTSQRNHVDCGPTAIANALKWAGASFSYAGSYKALIANCRAEDGTHWTDLTHELARWEREGVLKLKVWFRPTLKRIEKQLSKGGAVILDHARVNGGGHYGFVSDLRRGSFLVSNEYKGVETTIWISRWLFKDTLLRYEHSDSSYTNGYAWFLTRI